MYRSFKLYVFVCDSNLLKSFVLITIPRNAPEHKVLLSKLCSIQLSLSYNFFLLRRKTLSLVLIEDIGKNLSGQDKNLSNQIQQNTHSIYI